MSAAAAFSRQPVAAEAPDLESALILLCGLSPTAVASIHAMQQSMGIPFSEAALHLRHVTHADIDTALKRRDLPQVQGRRPLQPDRQLLVAHDPFSPRSETIRALRTDLLLRHEAERTQGANILAVVSPCAGEGRSLLAAELAIAFAQLGQSTLLVDADLRNPRQHVLFNSENEEGLAQAIVDGSAGYIHPVRNLPQMSLLTSGKTPPSPLEMLSDRRFADLVSGWRRHYQHVIIDTPPAAKFSDALASAALCGRVLMLSRAEQTPYRETREMLRRLSATQSRILGGVISHF